MPPYTRLLAISIAALLKLLIWRGCNTWFGYSLAIVNVTLSVPKYRASTAAAAPDETEWVKGYSGWPGVFKRGSQEGSAGC